MNSSNIDNAIYTYHIIYIYTTPLINIYSCSITFKKRVFPQVLFEKARHQATWDLLRRTVTDRQLLSEIARLASGGAPWKKQR